ncbi:hypothetical protein D3C81_1888830 [compost metagenome]
MATLTGVRAPSRLPRLLRQRLYSAVYCNCVATAASTRERAWIRSERVLAPMSLRFCARSAMAVRPLTCAREMLSNAW